MAHAHNTTTVLYEKRGPSRSKPESCLTPFCRAVVSSGDFGEHHLTSDRRRCSEGCKLKVELGWLRWPRVGQDVGKTTAALSKAHITLDDGSAQKEMARPARNILVGLATNTKITDY